MHDFQFLLPVPQPEERRIGTREQSPTARRRRLQLRQTRQPASQLVLRHRRGPQAVGAQNPTSDRRKNAMQFVRIAFQSPFLRSTHAHTHSYKVPTRGLTPFQWPLLGLAHAHAVSYLYDNGKFLTGFNGPFWA